MKKTTVTIEECLYKVTYENGNGYYMVRYWDEFGKKREKSLGSVAYVQLRDVKAEARRYRALSVLNKTNAKKNRLRQAREEEDRNERITFGEILDKALVEISYLKNWKNPRTPEQWHNTIRDYALPVIGTMPLRNITPEDIVKILSPIWKTKTETATKLRHRLETVFGWLAVNKYLPAGQNPAVWRHNLQYRLPAPNRIHKHHEAPTIDELRKAVAYFLDHQCPGSGLILFIIATVSRVSEVRAMTADQVDAGAKLWISPVEQQKAASEDRRVPLSSLAMRAFCMGAPKGLVFRGYSDGQMSVDYPRLRLQGIIHRTVTAHGIRSTFRDWCADRGIDDAVAEKCLSHSWGNATTRAYYRNDLLQKRRELLEQWAKTLMQPQADD